MLLKIPKQPVIKRSTKWPALRRKYLSQHPNCEFCGNDKSLDVHHIIPVHVSRELELEPSNLMTLCEGDNITHICHFVFGHLYNWMHYNKDIRQDQPEWNKKFNDQKALVLNAGDKYPLNY